MAPEGRGRGLCVLPPDLESVGNPAAVHVVSLDEDTAACPGKLDGACVIHLTTTTATTTTSAEAVSTEAEKAVEAFPQRGSGEGAGVVTVETAAPAAADGSSPSRFHPSATMVAPVSGEAGAAVAADAAGAAGAADAADLDDENGSEGVLGRAARELLAAAGVEEVGWMRP